MMVAAAAVCDLRPERPDIMGPFLEEESESEVEVEVGVKEEVLLLLKVVAVVVVVVVVVVMGGPEQWDLARTH